MHWAEPFATRYSSYVISSSFCTATMYHRLVHTTGNHGQQDIDLLYLAIDMTVITNQRHFYNSPTYSRISSYPDKIYLVFHRMCQEVYSSENPVAHPLPKSSYKYKPNCHHPHLSLSIGSGIGPTSARLSSCTTSSLFHIGKCGSPSPFGFPNCAKLIQ
jgi:hypothetical protein